MNPYAVTIEEGWSQLMKEDFCLHVFPPVFLQLSSNYKLLREAVKFNIPSLANKKNEVAPNFIDSSRFINQELVAHLPFKSVYIENEVMSLFMYTYSRVANRFQIEFCDEKHGSS